jgi:hypothetical protein
MRMRGEWFGLVAAAWVMAGCAGAGTGPVVEPSAVAPPPVIVGAGLPAQPAEPWLGPPAALASAVGAPVHAAGCAGSAALWGLFYALFFPGDFSQDLKALIGEECAGPYLVTPAELASPGLPWPPRALRTPRTGTVPVDEAVQQTLGPR